MPTTHPRARLRELGISIGSYPPGPLNAITDVPGVLVGHRTLIYDEPRKARTGVTVILPRDGQIHEDFAFAGFHCFNGTGEMTGIHLLEEFGLLTTPIALTNTNQVGLVLDSLARYGATHYGGWAYKISVVAETYDGWLNDINAFHLTENDVIAALESACGGPVAEGNVGGGTGMICHQFKGGIGSASRQVESEEEIFTIGALVQANYGERRLLRVAGVPVGRLMDENHTPLPSEKVDPDSSSHREGSIIVVIATDAPLIPTQCRRLAQRATVGLARVGGVGYNSSGDLFLSFSTGNHYPPSAKKVSDVHMLTLSQMDPFFEATAEAVEEAILNALTAAETMTGFKDRTVYALPLDDLQRIMADYDQVAKRYSSR